MFVLASQLHYEFSKKNQPEIVKSFLHKITKYVNIMQTQSITPHFWARSHCFWSHLLSSLIKGPYG